MSQIIDRRLNGKNKSAVNRQRFIRRYRQQIQEAVADAIGKRSVKDIDSGGTIHIPSKDISEPNFHHGPGGRRTIIHPGNREFVSGDRIPRRGGQGGGGGGRASNNGEGEDEFAFEISREEFLNFFFSDLQLPNLVKTKLATVVEHNKIRGGHSTSGSPCDLNIVRSLRGALGRKIALRSPYRLRLREAEAELHEILGYYDETHPRAVELIEEIRQLKQRMLAIPFIDTFDLRYNSRVKIPKPTTQAVMFCVMDVSGSMDQPKKDLAKRFFMLLYLFLTKTYERIDVVFIRHHTIAQEVDEETFFYARETGGTVVSSALKLLRDVIRERYPSSDWNIYAAQASDGDNWDDDSPICETILKEEIMPLLQYYAYIEVADSPEQSLWRRYQHVKQAFPNFAMERITGPSEIYPVFRELFKKQTA